MSFVYFMRPIHAPVEYPQPSSLPVVYFPTSYITYRFPVPVFYSTPPPAIL